MARHFDSDSKLTLKPPRGIICGGEVLTDEARAVIERVFSARVFERYGLREVDTVASHCPEGGFHVNDDNLLVKTVIDDLGESGRILITDLNNYVMPLVRYDTGDAVGPPRVRLVSMAIENVPSRVGVTSLRSSILPDAS